MFFSKVPEFGGSVTELRFEQYLPDDEKLVLRATVLTPMHIPEEGAAILQLANQAIKKTLWAGFRADWKEYNGTFRQVPDMCRLMNPAFEMLETYTYPFTIAAPSTKELIVLDWNAAIVSSLYNQDD